MEHSLNVYFAGELFSAKHLVGNALLAEAIWTLSKGRYDCHLPQNMEKRHTSPHSIRDEDIKSVLAADVAVFIPNVTHKSVLSRVKALAVQRS